MECELIYFLIFVECQFNQQIYTIWQKQKYKQFQLHMNQNFIRQSFTKQDDAETQSFSSFDSSKDKHAIIVKDLYNNVVKQLKKNQQKLVEVIKDNPYYNFALYRPNLLSNGQSKQNLNSQLLEKQLDRLMEDQYKLDKQLSKIEIKNQEDEHLKQIQTSNHIDHFSFLRNIWHRTSKQSSINSEGKLQQLNRKVVMIKGGLKAVKQREKQNNGQSEQLHKYIKSSKQFLQLNQKYEQLERDYLNKQQQYMNRIQQLQTEIQTVKSQNCTLLRKQAEETEKCKRKDDEIIKTIQKCQALELQILKKQKQIKRITQNSSNSCEQNLSLHLNKNLINISPQNIHKKLTYSNKNQGLTVVIVQESDSLTPEINNNILSTSRTLNEIKNYLASGNMLEGLIQSKYVGINTQINPSSLVNSLSATYLKSDLYDTLEMRMTSNRKIKLERADTLRSEYALGSADKRRRFQRTKLMENQSII